MTLKLLQPAEVTSAFLKMGLLGFQGSGKTKTASKTGTGLIKLCKELRLPYADKPAAFLDTETGSDWVIPDFKAAGIELVSKKTRAFADLLTVTREAEAECSLLIIDSISHFWKELTDSYCKRKAEQIKSSSYRLQFQDWAYLKGEWSKFTDLYVNSSLHIILCGRAGFEYDYFENDEGKRELEKTGIKMKAEGEMGYEPSLLVLMERQQKIEGNRVTSVWREATVIKDRSTLLYGQVFVDPDFVHFMPHIKRLNLGGKQLGVDTTRTSEHVISTEKKDWHSTQKTIVLEEIESLMVEFYPGQTKEDKQAKAALILKHFGTRSWTEVCTKQLIDLRASYDALHQELKQEPSRYAALLAPGAITTDLNDSLPDHSAPPIQQSLRETLLADLAGLTTPTDVLHWTLQVSLMTDLTMEDRNVINSAVMARQAEINKKAAPQEEEPEKDKPEPETPEDDKLRSTRKKLTAAEALSA